MCQTILELTSKVEIDLSSLRNLSWDIYEYEDEK
jgi:hypothetical protein